MMSSTTDVSLSRLEQVYSPLGDYLRSVSSNEDAVLSFAEVESLIGRSLPQQARSKLMWWQSVPRQPQSRAWLRADRRADADLTAETVTFVFEVFVRNNPLERIQRIRANWLGYARTSLSIPPRDAHDPHVELGWWEPHEVYLLHLPASSQFKVGLTRIGSKRLAAVGGARAHVVDRITMANRWAALVVEHHVLELAWDAWEQPDRFATGDKGETERWNDWLVPPPLSVVRDSLVDHRALPGWDVTVIRSGS
ncbi:DUF7662 domain-containing protein [Microbacterium luteum]|uniref:DUF7662 domain-containing protein n=1 Tax=Microbacterium luteum TaxID=2782167 RepID=UPI001888B0F1|nr:hypothetical protein [Microbacterium luteum]